jgi:hypothetical protein
MFYQEMEIQIDCFINRTIRDLTKRQKVSSSFEAVGLENFIRSVKLLSCA